MATLKTIRKRIASVKNTRKVTKAMKMIAAARLRRAQSAALGARAYEQHLREIAMRVAAGLAEGHPLLARTTTVRNKELIVLTSDRGLCGGFNENLVREVNRHWADDEAHGVNVQCTVIGRKGRDSLAGRGRTLREAFTGFYDGLSMEKILPVIEAATARFLAGEVDHVEIAFNRYKSAMAQDITFQTLLPIRPPQVTDENAGIDYLYEPARDEIVNRLLERSVAAQLYQACLESIAAELASRMAAMDSASKNASEMIDKLTTLLNRARQASITKDLLDIVNGAESLKS